MGHRVRVVFVCVGNSCRSQMAEALARHMAPDLLEIGSAGIHPLGHVAESTRRTLLESGIPMEGQFSKGMEHPSLPVPEVIVNLTGIPGAALFPNATVIDWDVTDPFGDDMETYRLVCDDIEARLREWINELRMKIPSESEDLR